MLIFDCKIVGADRWSAQKIRSIILMMLNAQTHPYENIKWIWTHPVCLRQTPLLNTVSVYGEPCLSSDQFFIRGEFNLPISYLPIYPSISIPISHFLLTHFYSVNGVGEPCQPSDQFFIRGEFNLSISHLPIYSFLFRERCTVNRVCLLTNSLQEENLTYPFPTYLFIHLLW